ncbi:hypothetical protein RHGRI_003594 [Rhododendron griersonianum]|uniref:Uncharacterized protein n=1 Tax=Rhododendron griersonianum TaxID=479676 RepID=A0AAV6L6N5_9ERIC|nr:hypothetical protein RHGRI_003594 [Rhododendron griersonianum]
MRMNTLKLQSNNQGFDEWNMGFEESEEMMMTCFYFPPSPTDFPLYRPMPSVFFVSSQQDISLALSFQHILEDKSGALHVINEEEQQNIFNLQFGDLHEIARAVGVLPKDMESLIYKSLPPALFCQRKP